LVEKNSKYAKVKSAGIKKSLLKKIPNKKRLSNKKNEKSVTIHIKVNEIGIIINDEVRLETKYKNKTIIGINKTDLCVEAAKK
tara:strand:- start:249 stop:497 length:249 start_codon:yes stop_codon:yes gene_type:complete